MTDASVDSAGTTTSSSLLQRAVLREPEAWQRLVTLYGPLVYHWCRSWGLQPGDAENVGQEVFLLVWQGLPTLRKGGAGDSFRGWLYRIARNCFFDHHRRAGSEPPSVGGSEALRMLQQTPQADETDKQNAEMISKENAVLYRRAVEFIRGEFSDRDWQAFSGVVLGGEEPAAVAQRLAVSVNVVYLAKSRVLRRLREQFAVVIEM